MGEAMENVLIRTMVNFTTVVIYPDTIDEDPGDMPEIWSRIFQVSLGDNGDIYPTKSNEDILDM